MGTGRALLLLLAAATAGCSTLRAARLFEDALRPADEVAPTVVERVETFSDSRGDPLRVRITTPVDATQAPPAILIVHGAHSRVSWHALPRRSLVALRRRRPASNPEATAVSRRRAASPRRRGRHLRLRGMSAASFRRTNISGRQRTWRFAAGFVVIVTLPAWNALAATGGLELRGLAAIGVLPIAWLGCLWLAEAMKGVSARLVDHEEIVSESPESLEELKAARRAVYVAATITSFLIVGAIAYATR